MISREQAEANKQCPVCGSLGRAEAWRPGNEHWAAVDMVKQLRAKIVLLEEQLKPKSRRTKIIEDVDINEQT